MDVDPEQSEAEIVQELERTQKDPGEFFESVPVVVFADKAKQRGRKREEKEQTEESSSESSSKAIPIWLWLIPAAIGVMVLAGGAMAMILYLLKA